jgi:hypothetical protein
VVHAGGHGSNVAGGKVIEKRPEVLRRPKKQRLILLDFNVGYYLIKMRSVSM